MQLIIILTFIMGSFTPYIKLYASHIYTFYIADLLCSCKIIAGHTGHFHMITTDDIFLYRNLDYFYTCIMGDVKDCIAHMFIWFVFSFVYKVLITASEGLQTAIYKICQFYFLLTRTNSKMTQRSYNWRWCSGVILIPSGTTSAASWNYWFIHSASGLSKPNN